MMEQDPFGDVDGRAPGRVPRDDDDPSLGPSDSSDSGSDVAVVGPAGAGNPRLPIDKAMREGELWPFPRSGHSDRSTGKRRRGASDDDGVDIDSDRVASPARDEDVDSYEDPDLDFMDTLDAEQSPTTDPDLAPRADEDRQEQRQRGR